MLKKQLLAILCAVLLGFTVAGSPFAAEQMPAEMIVAMASSKTVCGGNTGRACPGTAPVPTPPVAASPVIPATKPSPTPTTATPPASTPAISATPTPAPSTTPTPVLTTTPSGGPAGYTFCANENSTCNFSGTKSVAYGANGKFNSFTLSGGTACTNTVFTDPLVGTVKACYIKEVSIATPTPSSPIQTPLPSQSPTPAIPPLLTNSSGSQWTSFASDPEGGIGFNTAFWASSINRMVVMFGTSGSGSQGGDNSVRAFDPVTNTWTYLYTSNPPVGSPNHLGIPNRDNHASFYVPARDEIWIWGGSHIDAMPDPQQRIYSGRFSLAGCHPVVSTNCGQWVYRSLNYADHADIVKNGVPGFGTNPGCAWSTSANTGMCAFGGGNSPVNDYMIVEPNNARSICSGAGAGSHPYVACSPQGGVRPPIRDQCQNCMVAAGNDFYVYGGQYQLPPTPTDGGYRMRTDLWKYSTVTHTWTQLPDGPALSLVLTYDSDRNQLVSWSFDHLYVFDLASGQWSDQTPAGMPCVGNNLGVYAPTVKLHVYDGGLHCSTNGNYYGTYAISLSGSGTITPTPTPTSSTYPTGPSSYTFCANENQTCSFSGTKAVAFGASGQFKFKNISGGTNCSNAVFGDPILNTAKACFTSDVLIQTPPPTPTPPVTPTTIQTGSTCYGGLCMPSRTWIARSYSDVPAGAPGNGGAGGTYGGKHQNSATSLDDGKTYWVGGDGFNVLNGDNIGTWSYDPVASVSIAWTRLKSDCGAQGELMPGGPNESGFVWDSTRHKFWLFPGFWFLGQSGASGCGGGGQGGQLWDVSRTLVLDGYAMYFVYDHGTGVRYVAGTDYSIAFGTPSPGKITLTNIKIPANANQGCSGTSQGICVFWQTNGNALQQVTIMTFDPVTKVWTNAGAACEPYGSPPCSHELPKNGLYDPMTDSIWRAGDDHRGRVWTQYFPATNTWGAVGTACATGDDRAWDYALNANGKGIQGPCNPGQIYINDGRPSFEWIAADIARRKIYIIDAQFYRLLEFDMDTHAVVIKAQPPILGAPPCPAGANSNSCHDFTQPQFDPINNVLLYPWFSPLSGPVLLIYHPDTNTWETDPMYQPEGIRVRGNHSNFDPIHNVLMVYGGLCEGRAECGGMGNIGNADSTLTHYFLYRYGNGK